MSVWKRRKLLALLKQTFVEFSNDRCPQLAASLSYYTIFSLAPLLVIGIMISGLVFDADDVRGKVKKEVQSLIGPDGAEQVATMIAATEVPDQGSIASIASIGLLTFGAIGLVGQLQSAMNLAWQVAPDPAQGGIKTFLLKRVFSLAILLGGGFLMMVSLLLSTIVTAFGDWISTQLPGEMSTTLLQVLNTIVTLVAVFVLFASMFKFLPDAKIAWKDVMIGAFATAILFVVGKFAMGVYLGSRNMESTFGAAGSLALLLTWIYYTAIIFLLGAEFTQVWAKHRGADVQPEPGAVQVIEKRVTLE